MLAEAAAAQLDVPAHALLASTTLTSLIVIALLPAIEGPPAHNQFNSA